jgi:AcrR family transcriptional regulator
LNSEYFIDCSDFSHYRLAMADQTSVPTQTDPRADATRQAPEQDEIRVRIQRAAENRFIRYGFGKTTMAEIAADCGMSAGNLYRFFDNKGDIAAASARDWLAALEAELSGIGRDTARAPADRLRQVILAKLDALAKLVEAEPHLEELIEHVCRSREDLVANHRSAIRALLTGIIEEGVASGDFDIANPAAAAEAIQVGTVGLFHHTMICTVPSDRLRSDAIKIIDLLIRGLGQR